MASYTHIYFGDGKGKTTAALGLAIRAAGFGMNVVIVQFLKDQESAELKSLALLPKIKVLRGKASGAAFFMGMNEAEKQETKNIHDANLREALELHQEGLCDMLILDEAIDAHRLGVLDKELFEGLLRDKPENLELIVTGHRPSRELLSYGDYVTEMVKHKHPYSLGVKGRDGIEW